MIIKKPKPTEIKNVTIEAITPAQLHANWNWLRRGALDVLNKVRGHTLWTPEDLYAALKFPSVSNTTGFIVSRGQRALGWAAVELQVGRYEQRELFLWAGWTIPLRERLPGDDVPGAHRQLMEYLRVLARSQNCIRISCLSSRRLEYLDLGWTPSLRIFYIPV